MNTNLHSVALKFVDGNLTGTIDNDRHYDGRFFVVGQLAVSYSEVIAFHDKRGGRFYATTEKFSGTTSKHENVVREAILERVEPSMVVVVADIWNGAKECGIEGFDTGNGECIYID